MTTVRLKQVEQPPDDDIKDVSQIASDEEVSTRTVQRWIAMARSLGYDIGVSHPDGRVTYNRDERIIISMARFKTLPPKEAKEEPGRTGERPINHHRIANEGLVIQTQADERERRLSAIQGEAIADLQEEFCTYAETYTAGRLQMETAKSALRRELDFRLQQAKQEGYQVTADYFLKDQ